MSKQQSQKQIKLILPMASDRELEFQKDLLVHACKHMIELNEQNIKRHRTYLKDNDHKIDSELRATMNQHINADIMLIGHYQNLIKKIENDAAVIVHS